VEKEEIRNVEFAVRRKEKLVKDEEYKKKREEERMAELAARPNPYVDEIENCDFLARYCKKIKSDWEKRTHS